ncbi:MAG: mechanosensitive ion channel family protein [Chloroflexi bacterium]|nr:mechanosensitive ion channel family protein [Chloroflexota bacterium]
MNVLSNVVYGNSLWQWGVGLLVMIFTFAALKLILGLAGQRLQKISQRTATTLDDFFITLLRNTKNTFLIILSINVGIQWLILPQAANDLLRVLTIIAAVIQVGFWLNELVDYLVKERVQRNGGDNSQATTLNALNLVGKTVIWSVILLVALDNIPGVNVTTLIASLGVTGIAVGLAVQNILSDLFASLSIALDKPFVIGDFIIVGEFMGTVEHIGLKSTRVRSLSGEQLVFSNSDLLNSRIRNYKRMVTRRIVFTVSASYNTPQEKLAEIPGMLREIIEGLEKATFDRAHLKTFGAVGVDYEVVYIVQDSDYNLYMDLQQAINLEIYRRFSQNGIEFPDPLPAAWTLKTD